VSVLQTKEGMNTVKLCCAGSKVCTFFAWVGLIMKFCKNLTGPCGAPSYLPYLPLPTYLPTYLPAYLPTLLMGNKKEIIGRVKVGLLYQLK